MFFASGGLLAQPCHEKKRAIIYQSMRVLCMVFCASPIPLRVIRLAGAPMCSPGMPGCAHTARQSSGICLCFARTIYSVVESAVFGYSGRDAFLPFRIIFGINILFINKRYHSYLSKRSSSSKISIIFS